jgi:tetratricopeptide (TPR) repeat protein
MIQENRKVVEEMITEAESQREISDWGGAKIKYLEALEAFQGYVAEQGKKSDETEDEKTLKNRIMTAISEIDAKLAAKHRELGLSAYETKDYERAIEELEEAINLASDQDLAFMEDVKKALDKARVKDMDQKVYEEITPFVARGDEFRKAGNFGEAILEYQEALKPLSGLPPEHRYAEYIHAALKECRRNLVRPYLTSIYRASSQGNVKKAFQILQRVQLLVDEQDTIYSSFLEQIKEGLASHLKKEDIEEDAADGEGWAKAVADYEEALQLHQSYSATDPLSPAYTSGNRYEERFLKTRRNLARLYADRGRKLAETAQVQKAIKNFKEALKLLPRSDHDFGSIFREMKRLRAQLVTKTV